ncbi:MAG: hypothetical protein R3B09_33685 [Nannocystaceae bacterium]
MLDLKGKLAAAGLVTREEIEALERGREGKRQGRGPAPGPAQGPGQGRGKKGRGPASPPRPRPGLDVAALGAAGKGERYDAIRRQVDAQRLDNPGPIPAATAEPFHFTTAGGQLSRLYVDPPLRERLSGGEAAIVAFMSNHGLAHAVVPPALAVDIAALFPLWLRVLQDHPGAGLTEAPKEPTG